MLLTFPSSLAFIMWMKGIDEIHNHIKEVSVVILTRNIILLKKSNVVTIQAYVNFQWKRLLCLPARTRKDIFGEYDCSIGCLVERWITDLSAHTSSHPLNRQTIVLTYWVKRVKRWLLNVLENKIIWCLN